MSIDSVSINQDVLRKELQELSNVAVEQARQLHDLTHEAQVLENQVYEVRSENQDLKKEISDVKTQIVANQVSKNRSFVSKVGRECKRGLRRFGIKV